MASFPEKAVHGAGKQLGGFRKFLVRGNVVDLAVGVVIGAAFGNVVNSVVDNLINPLVGIFGGGPNLKSWVIPIAGQQIQIGNIINALISFVLIAVVVYFLVVLPVNKLMDRYKPEPKPAPTKD
jgi:large conductance mechanosensitive channel